MAKKQFQSEIKELLDLMIHSLYSNKEIFLRELISNASDALDKLNYLTLSDDNYKLMKFNPQITISFDEDKGTLSIADNGIGMDESDLDNNLGTIAKSGTKHFLSNLSEEKKKDAALIGQFGVGFYSCFMVAQKVVVTTKKALDSKAYTWISDGSGEYEILESSKDTNGTEITLYLKDNSKDFLSTWRLKDMIKTYSNHIQFPIFLAYYESKGDDKDSVKELKEEQVNNAKALWITPKNELKEQDYHEFYKTLHYDKSDPIAYVHTIAEGTLQYKSLFFIPDTPPMNLSYDTSKSYVKLYVKRVFISDDMILPAYLRFVVGIIDSDDLPLNVSREILQENKILEQIKDASVKKILGMIEQIAKDEEKYKNFYKKYGEIIKWGLQEDFKNKDRVLELIRVYSYKQRKYISLKEYKDNMKEGLDKILYITGNNLDLLKNNPLLEKFKDMDVLLFADRIDEYIMPTVYEYQGVKLANITTKEVLDGFKSTISEDVKKSFENTIKSFESLDNVSSVELSDNIESPLSLVNEQGGNAYMEEMMRAMGQTPPPSKYIVEINVNHALIKKINAMDSDLRDRYSQILLDGAKILNGQSLDDSKQYIDGVNELLLRNL